MIERPKNWDEMSIGQKWIWCLHKQKELDEAYVNI